MGLSIPSQRWSVPETPKAPAPKVGLTPEMLREAGILTDPSKPDQACRRARALVAQGQYREARDLVLPHSRSTDRDTWVQTTEILAHCAIAGVGADGETLLRSLLAAHTQSGYSHGVARARRDLGELLLHAGRLKEASRQLQQAVAIFEDTGDEGRTAEADCLRARLLMRAGYANRAIDCINGAIERLVDLDAPRRLALARLERGRIHAHCGDQNAAARDLVAAERFLGASGSHLDRLRAPLARAECLLLVGEPRRAAQGLKRILVDVVQVEETRIRAWVHLLLGDAMLDRDPSASRRYLMRSRHLYDQLGHDYAIAACEIGLARAENRIGLNARGRLKQLWQKSFAEWGRLAALMNVARAEIEGEKAPEKARLSLFKARAFACDSGDQSLLFVVDATLRATGLVDEETARDLTPIQANTHGSTVEAGYGNVPKGPTLVVKPMPFPITDPAELARQAARKISPRVNKTGAIALKPPMAVGVRAGWQHVPARREVSAS